MLRLASTPETSALVTVWMLISEGVVIIPSELETWVTVDNPDFTVAENDPVIISLGTGDG